MWQESGTKENSERSVSVKMQVHLLRLIVSIRWSLLPSEAVGIQKFRQHHLQQDIGDYMTNCRKDLERTWVARVVVSTFYYVGNLIRLAYTVPGHRLQCLLAVVGNAPIHDFCELGMTTLTSQPT